MNELNQLKEPLVREDFVIPIIGISFLLLFLLLVFIAYNFRAYTSTILLNNIRVKNSNEKSVLESSRNKKGGMWLTIFFLFTVTILVFNFLPHFLNHLSSFNHFGYLFLILGAVVFLFAFKYMLKKIIGKVFQKERLTEMSVSQLGIKDKGYGLILFPLLILYNFSLPLKEISFIIILCISCVYFLLRWINGFLVGIKHGNIPYFYAFLYICTLEIIPVALAIKVFSKPILSILA
ncbi:MAG: hypothetical protein CMD20_00560 [Flavobacteriales bacterium]|nr:hypothetical protein [Flavobacteriales bacterium]